SPISASRKLAPTLSPCACTAGSTLDADTTAPSRRAVAVAWSPATPAPSTSTLAGVRVPAAVTSIGKSRPVATAASRTALYPATVACDDSTSIACARVMRGRRARLNAVTLRAASCDTVSRSAAGWNDATSAAPSRHRRGASMDGRWTLTAPSTRPNTSAPAPHGAPAAPHAPPPEDPASPPARLGEQPLGEVQSLGELVDLRLEHPHAAVELLAPT